MGFRFGQTVLVLDTPWRVEAFAVSIVRHVGLGPRGLTRSGVLVSSLESFVVDGNGYRDFNLVRQSWTLSLASGGLRGWQSKVGGIWQ